MANLFINNHRTIRSGWWVLIFFAILTACLLPAILFAQSQKEGVTLPEQAALLAFVTVVCQIIRKRPLTEITGSINKRFVINLGKGALIGAILMLLPSLLLWINGQVRWLLNTLSYQDLLAGFSVCFWVAITEEILFRGFIFQRLIEATGTWPAQILIAALFLLTHLNNRGMTGNIKIMASVNIFIASILFGFAYLRTNDLAMPLGIHFMANWIQGPLLGFGVSGNETQGMLRPLIAAGPNWLTGGSFGLEASLPGLLVLLGITWVFCKEQPLFSLLTKGIR